MKNIALVIVLFMMLFILIVMDKHDTVVYDCGMAEWHPDIPKAVKDECRKMHRDERQRLNQDKKTKLIST